MAATATPSNPLIVNNAPRHATSHLLSLPLELRRQIYRYTLPRTFPLTKTNPAPTWQKGNTSILATNKQIYEEAIDMMYGSSTFVVEVNYDCISFMYRWFATEGSAVSNRLEEHAFPEAIAPRNIARIRKLRVHVCPPNTFDYPDANMPTSGTFEGSEVDGRTEIMQLTTLGGLQAAINAVENQMSMLFVSLRQMQEVQDLRVSLWLEPTQRHKGYDKTLLMPLSKLKNVRELTLGGNITEEFERKLYEECFGSMEKVS